MSTMICPAASLPKSGAIPQLCSGMPSTRHYRRSTTTKAPRKRTFISNMEKFDARLIAPAGVSCLGTNNVAMLSIGNCRDDLSVGGGDSGNNNRGGNKRRGGNNGDGEGFADGAPRFQSLMPHALLGALALTVAYAAFPAASQAAQAFPSPARAMASRRSSSAGSMAARPRSKVLHVACKGSTLVVPLPAGGETKEMSAVLARSGDWQNKKILDAPIALSAQEAAMVAAPQFRVRESLRV